MRTAAAAVVLSAVIGLATSSAFAQDVRHMKNDFIGCKTKDLYSDSLQMMKQRDWVAVSRLILSGQCAELSKGTPVYRTGASITSLVKIRARGQTSEWWTGAEQVSD